ncbi:MAG TPA: DUF502 domain-containing protein [Actinomycetota bacterium]|nr:DUF502 domain-containing protein [Actinomycetota bacterium]
MNGLGKLLRRRLIAGLIVIAPLGVTAYILWWLFRAVDGILGNAVYQLIGFPIPGLGLLLLLALLLGVGWLAERTVGSQILEWWHAALDRVPVVSRLYNATRRIVGSVFGGEERRFFREVVLFEYPSAGQWTLGFVTGRAPRALAEKMSSGLTVFLPTAPNPVTGFLIIVPEERIIRLPVTVEEGFTYILSAGAVPPMGVPGQAPDARAAAEAVRRSSPDHHAGGPAVESRPLGAEQGPKRAGGGAP